MLFVVFALAGNSVLFTLLYLGAKKALIKQMQSTVLSIASTASAAVNADQHQRIRNPAEGDSSEYTEMEAFLRKLRDANRRPDVQVKFIYTIAPSGDSRKMGHYVVDAEEEGGEKSHFGETYKAEGEVLDFENAQSPSEFVRDQFGFWLTAMVPIRNPAGKSIAILGVDISADEVVAQTRRLLWSGLVTTAGSLLLAVCAAMMISRNVTRALAQIDNAVQLLGQGKLDTRIGWKSRDEFGSLAAAINGMAIGLQQRENLKSTLASYVSQQVADEILTTGKMAEVRSERRKVTILFADVRGFTALSEGMSPEDVVAMLNEYFEKMIEAIFRHRGTLNKFIGDGLMAMFGAPADDPYQEKNAILAALEMQKEMVLLQEKFRKGGHVDFRIGIGINTGIAVVGNIGSSQKMEYTAIGDTVNSASRLEGKTKELGADILVSEYTYVAVRNTFKFTKGGLTRVKGKSDPIQVYAVEGVAET